MESNQPANLSPESLPEATVRPGRRFSVIWIVPLVAAILAGILFYRAVVQTGPKVTILFNDGSGLRAGQTVIKFRGITVGTVDAVTLSDDQEQVAVHARLDKSAAFLAREGSAFWVVRPEISLDAIRGLGTLVSGSFIQVTPGTGDPAHEFVGVERPPAMERKDGLKLLLMSPQLGFIKAGSPVYYRGIEVGAVEKYDLSTNARAVNIHVVIDRMYAPLIRAETRFWNAGGVSMNWSLFRGFDLSAETFKSLVSGGVAFATPDSATNSASVTDGMVFRLYERPEDDWLRWSPGIELPTPK